MVDQVSLSSVYLRTLAHDARFDAEAAAIYGGLEKADDALKAVEFALSREPQTEGARFEDTEIYVLKVAASSHTKGIVVFYRFDACIVTLMSIVESPAQE